MYSAELTLKALQAAARIAPGSLQGPLDSLLQSTQDLVQAQAGSYAVLDAVPDTTTQALQAAVAALHEHFQERPLAVGPLLDFHFELQRFERLVEALSDHSLLDVQTLAAVAGKPLMGPAADAVDGPAATDARLSVRNVAPAIFLRQRFAALHSITLFSATLAPPDYAIRLLGLPPNTTWLDVPPAFAPEHLTVRVAAGISTRYADRDRSLRPLVTVITDQFDAHPGNYLAFFSSFEYLDKAATRLALLRPDIRQWRQDRRMGAEARQGFLERFAPEGRGIGFAVLGGVFAEGVDLPGSMLIGAFIATLGLPPVSAMQAQMQARLEKLFGADQGYADLVPAMQRVVQAAGRVLRTPEDRGWLWLLDGRYLRADVAALLPAWWRTGQMAGFCRNKDGRLQKGD
jgi:Rad3-related DNA helicase